MVGEKETQTLRVVSDKHTNSRQDKETTKDPDGEWMMAYWFEKTFQRPSDKSKVVHLGKGKQISWVGEAGSRQPSWPIEQG